MLTGGLYSRNYGGLSFSAQATGLFLLLYIMSEVYPFFDCTSANYVWAYLCPLLCPNCFFIAANAVELHGIGADCHKNYPEFYGERVDFKSTSQFVM